MEGNNTHIDKEHNRISVLFIFGGIPHYLAPLLKILVQKGINVQVVMPLGGNGKVIGEGVKLIKKEYPFPVFPLRESIGWYGKPKLNGLRDLIIKNNPDILVMSWPYVLQLVFNPLLYRSLRKRNIFIFLREIPFQVPPRNKLFSYFKEKPFQNESLSNPGKNRIVFWINQVILAGIRSIYYRNVDGILHYVDGAAEIPVSYGVKNEKIIATYNSPDTDVLLGAFEALQAQGMINEETQKIIHVGRLVAWKKVDLLIKSVSLLIKEFPKIELIIVGDGPQRNELEKLTSDMGIQRNVNFVGDVYDPMILGKLLIQSDIYVLAGMGGLSINEAMAFAKPVICSVCDGTEKNMVRDYVNGLFFKPDSISDLADKIKYLLLRPDERKKMGQESQRIIREEINIHTVADKFVKAFQWAYNKNERNCLK